MSFKKCAVIFGKDQPKPHFDRVVSLIDLINDYHGFHNNNNDESNDIKYVELKATLDTRDQDMHFVLSIDADYHLLPDNEPRCFTFFQSNVIVDFLGNETPVEKEYAEVIDYSDLDFEKAILKLISYENKKIDPESINPVLTSRFHKVLFGDYCSKPITSDMKSALQMFCGVDPYFEYTEVCAFQNKNTTKYKETVLGKEDEVGYGYLAKVLDNLVLVNRHTQDVLILRRNQVNVKTSRLIWQTVFCGNIKTQRQYSNVASLVGIQHNW